jgi:hypothetical protein
MDAFALFDEHQGLLGSGNGDEVRTEADNGRVIQKQVADTFGAAAADHGQQERPGIAGGDTATPASGQFRRTPSRRW